MKSYHQRSVLSRLVAMAALAAVGSVVIVAAWLWQAREATALKTVIIQVAPLGTRLYQRLRELRAYDIGIECVFEPYEPEFVNALQTCIAKNHPSPRLCALHEDEYVDSNLGSGFKRTLEMEMRRLHHDRISVIGVGLIPPRSPQERKHFSDIWPFRKPLKDVTEAESAFLRRYVQTTEATVQGIVASGCSVGLYFTNKYDPKLIAALQEHGVDSKVVFVHSHARASRDEPPLTSARKVSEVSPTDRMSGR